MTTISVSRKVKYSMKKLVQRMGYNYADEPDAAEKMFRTLAINEHMTRAILSDSKPDAYIDQNELMRTLEKQFGACDCDVCMSAIEVKGNDAKTRDGNVRMTSHLTSPDAKVELGAPVAEETKADTVVVADKVNWHSVCPGVRRTFVNFIKPVDATHLTSAMMLMAKMPDGESLVGGMSMLAIVLWSKMHSLREFKQRHEQMQNSVTRDAKSLTSKLMKSITRAVDAEKRCRSMDADKSKAEDRCAQLEGKCAKLIEQCKALKGNIGELEAKLRKAEESRAKLRTTEDLEARLRKAEESAKASRQIALNLQHINNRYRAALVSWQHEFSTRVHHQTVHIRKHNDDVIESRCQMQHAALLKRMEVVKAENERLKHILI